MYRILCLIAILGFAFSAPLCSLSTQQEMAGSILNQVDKLIDASIVALHAYALQSKYFRTSMTGSPALDSTSNKAQQSIWNIMSFHDSVYVYTGWEDNGFVGYFKQSVGANIVFDYQEAGTTKSNTYNINPTTGMSSGSSLKENSYQCTIRPWYTAAKGACKPDPNDYYVCAVIITPLYASVFDGALTFTPALAMPNWEGNSQFEFTNDVYPFGGANTKISSTHGGASAISGVVATDIPCGLFNDILAKEVSIGGAAVAYMMDTDNNLVAVSDGSAVSIISASLTATRLPAPQSKSPLIASTSAYLQSNSFLSDNTIIWNKLVITVRKYSQNSVKWYIVVVNNYDSLESCDFAVQKLALNDVVHAVDSSLQSIVNAGKMLSGGINLGLFPNSMTAPSLTNLWKLGGSSAAINLQSMIIAVGLTFPQVSWLYVGYPDNTFTGYVMKDTGGFGTFEYRNGTGPDRHGYYTNQAGAVANPDYVNYFKTNKDYVTTGRPWYTAAEAVKKPVWSAPYVFASETGEIGMTYSIPFYDGTGTLMGVVGIDFTLGAAAKVIEQFGDSGTIYYAMETAASPPMDNSGDSAAYNLLFSSSMANAVNPSGTAQNKATDQQSVKDYYIATSANYIKDTSSTYDGTFTTGPLQGTLTNYQKFGLFWRFVGVSYQYPTSSDAPSGVSSSPSAAEKDGTNMYGVATATLTLVILQMVITLGSLGMIFMIFKNKERNTAATISGDNVQSNPMNSADANHLKL